MRRTTIKDVAHEAGVSIGTVSAVLNRRDSVRPLTRKRVQGIIDRLNYRPVEAARRRLGSPREKTLGLVVKEIHNPYFADIIVGAQEEARKHDFRLLVMSSEQVFAREVDAVRVLVAKDIDGLIINPLLESGTPSTHFEDLEAHNIPFVMIEGLSGDTPSLDEGLSSVSRASVVDIDNEQGAYDATMHLLNLGHTDLVHLAGPRYSQHALERSAGVLRAAPRARMVHAGATLEDGFRAARECLCDAPFTALICYNDLVAIGAIRQLMDRGIDIPGEVSVVGFDDIDVASFLGVPLTTVRIPKKEMGRQAAAIAIQQIHSNDDAQAKRVLLDAELIVRSTTRCR